LKPELKPEAPLRTGQLGNGAVTVRFAKSGVTAHWSPDNGSLLALAEAVGLAPVFCCRSGICGTCIISYNVDYIEEPLARRSESQVLPCCSIRAASLTKGSANPGLLLELLGGYSPQMEMLAQVLKWGNRLAICLPASVVDPLELKEAMRSKPRY